MPKDAGVNMTLVDFGIIGAAERRDGYVWRKKC